MEQIPGDVLDWWCFPIEAYLRGQEPSESILPWLERSRHGWDVSDRSTAQMLDGAFVVPLLSSLRTVDWLPFDEGRPSPAWQSADTRVRDEIEQLFTHLGWATQVDGQLQLTELGRFLTDRALIVGTLAAYTPMLSQLGELLTGDPTNVFARDDRGHERHVERTLNVVASGFQHEKYFTDVRDIIISIFDRPPIAEQPRFVADMGCGDGTFLKQLFQVVAERTERGRKLDEHPLQMIGADYNEKALAATARTLGDIPHVVVQGDIGDPQRLMSDLDEVIGATSDDVLHVRSFLDHDRPLLEPADASALKRRAELPYPGVYIDDCGAAISPAVVVQSLVEHLARWANVATRHGLVVLEVHSVDPLVTRRFLDQSESLHFDAYHAYSGQYLVDADLFMMCAAEVGLFARYFRRYPKTLPFCRITLSWFEKRSYTIRHIVRDDVGAIGELLRICQSSGDDPSDAWLGDAVASEPLHSYVAEVDGRLVAAAFCRRDDDLLNCQHLLVHPRHRDKELHAEFLEFIELQADLKADVTKLAGAAGGDAAADSTRQSPASEPGIPQLVANTVHRLMEVNGTTYSTEKTFYELGLDSLDHMEMATLLAKELDIKLDSSILLKHDTPQKLSSHLERRAGKRGLLSFLRSD